MTIQDYWDACRAIHSELAAIATEIYNMALSQCANPSNPRYVALMDKRHKLAVQLADLDKQPFVP